MNVLLIEDDDGCAAMWLQTGYVVQGKTADIAYENLVKGIKVNERLEAEAGSEPWAGASHAEARYFTLWEQGSDWNPTSKIPFHEAYQPLIRLFVNR